MPFLTPFLGEGSLTKIDKTKVGTNLFYPQTTGGPSQPTKKGCVFSSMAIFASELRSGVSRLIPSSALSHPFGYSYSTLLEDLGGVLRRGNTACLKRPKLLVLVSL